MRQMWSDIRQRSFLMAMVLDVLLCVLLTVLNVGSITALFALLAFPLFLFAWPSIERVIRLRYANYRHEHGMLPTPSTEYCTPPESIVHPKQDYIGHEQEPMSMY